jgi:predicted DCC family thiol-disulfide oxidoreductase YuxK
VVQKTDSNIVVLFDGVCNLCNGAVQFLIRRDHKGVFRFASLQSGPAQVLLKGHQLKSGQFDSIVVVKAGQVYERSDAVMILANALGFPWKLMVAGKVLPRFLRDGLYNFISRNRYRIFGRRESCMIPDPAHKGKFLE